MPNTNILPLWYDDCADDLRAAGPAVMLVACFLKYIANSIGFCRLKVDVVSRATGVPLAEINAAIVVLEQIGFLRYHTDTQVMWILNHARRILGQLRANDRKGITLANAEFAAIPKDCPLRVDFLWRHALMLRLEVPGASAPNEASFETEDEMPPDLLSEVIPKAAGSPGRNI